jgi:hypothetical protein
MEYRPGLDTARVVHLRADHLGRRGRTLRFGTGVTEVDKFVRANRRRPQRAPQPHAIPAQ